MSRVLALMGSGETSPTMVKTHRALLERSGGGAVLLDTPFGFQSNADELTSRAQQYFAESVGRPLEVASFRSASEVGSVGYEQALGAIRTAGYVFAGPGSPTYALRQWRASAIPALLEAKLTAAGGGCVTFASAAALTLGLVTVPVYEIYKVGADPAWEEGLDLLGAATGLRAAVIPHFNNAEGGTHDTRFCYLGEGRLTAMEAALPEGAFVLGIDEHTGLVIDLDEGTAAVVGLGVVTTRWRGGAVRTYEAGTTMAISDLGSERSDTGGRGGPTPSEDGERPAGPRESTRADLPQSPLLDIVGDAEERFAKAMGSRDVEGAVQVVLDLEADLHAWANETFSSDEMDRARASFRGMLVRLAASAGTGMRDPRDVLGPFVDALLRLRQGARADKRFGDADAVRDQLVALGIEVRDTPAGTEWDLQEAP